MLVAMFIQGTKWNGWKEDDIVGCVCVCVCVCVEGAKGEVNGLKGVICVLLRFK